MSAPTLTSWTRYRWELTSQAGETIRARRPTRDKDAALTEMGFAAAHAGAPCKGFLSALAPEEGETAAGRVVEAVVYTADGMVMMRVSG